MYKKQMLMQRVACFMSIVASAIMTPRTGIVTFTAASPAVPTARATRTPSMMK